MANRITDESFVTLATNDNYVLGALTLAHSLKQVSTTRSLTVLITNNVTPSLQDLMRSVFDNVVTVDVMDSKDTVNLELLKRPELGVTFTKLHCWRLVQFKKCVFLDADTLVLKNVDELFEREEFSAATDIGWPDCFNSGVFVFKPSLDTYLNLLKFSVSSGSFDGGDQGLLNSFFSDWSTSESSRRLPFIYNMTTNVSYSYAPAFSQFRSNVKIVHFIGAQKPWYNTYNVDSETVVGKVTTYECEHLNMWWSIFVKNVFPNLDNEIKQRVNSQLIKKEVPNTSNPAPFVASYGASSSTTYPHGSGSEASGTHHGGVEIGSEKHQTMWEHGQIEYKGRDSFDNIQAHLDSQIAKK